MSNRQCAAGLPVWSPGAGAAGRPFPERKSFIGRYSESGAHRALAAQACVFVCVRGRGGSLEEGVGVGVGEGGREGEREGGKGGGVSE